MGRMRDAVIAEWQQRAGLTPASGEYLRCLREISDRAFELIKIVELEKSGVRDGDGYWSGSDPLGGVIRELEHLFEIVEGARSLPCPQAEWSRIVAKQNEGALGKKAEAEYAEWCLRAKEGTER